MAIKAIVDDLDSVEETIRPLYEEQNGKYVLQVEDFKRHPAFEALTASLNRIGRDKRAADEKLASLEERFSGLPEDFDADTYAALEARAAGQDPAKVDERLAKQREADAKKMEAEVAKREARLSKMEAALRKTKVDDGLNRALIEAGVSREYLSLAKAYLKEQGKIRLVEDDDDFEVFADDGIDERTPLTKFVGDWVSNEGKHLVPKPTGGNASGGTGQRFTENPFDTKGGTIKPNMTKMQEAIEANPEKARQMAIAAGQTPTW